MGVACEQFSDKTKPFGRSRQREGECSIMRKARISIFHERPRMDCAEPDFAEFLVQAVIESLLVMVTYLCSMTY
jgi:hypothetical protein